MKNPPFCIKVSPKVLNRQASKQPWLTYDYVGASLNRDQIWGKFKWNNNRKNVIELSEISCSLLLTLHNSKSTIGRQLCFKLIHKEITIDLHPLFPLFFNEEGNRRIRNLLLLLLCLIYSKLKTWILSSAVSKMPACHAQILKKEKKNALSINISIILYYIIL